MGKVRQEFLAITEEQAKNKNCRAYIKDETTGKCYGIPVGYFTIGRKDDMDVDIPIETEDGTISRMQADIRLVRNIIGEFELSIQDKPMSVNETEVGGHPISKYRYTQLFDGERILMGETEFSVYLNPIVDWV